MSIRQTARHRRLLTVLAMLLATLTALAESPERDAYFGDTHIHSLRLSGPPLDFLMVSDHARYMGVFAAQLDPEAPHYGHPDAAGIADQGLSLDTVIRRMLKLSRDEPAFMGPEVAEYAWQKIIDAAERHHEPGRDAGRSC